MLNQRFLPYFLLFIVVLGLSVPTSRGASSSSAGQQLQFGVKMAQRGLWSEALFRFRQAEKQMPSDAGVLNNLAVSCEAVGLFDEALEYYQRALKVDPSSRDLKRNYSRFAEFYQAFKPQDDVDALEAGENPSDEEETADGESAKPQESAL